MTTTRLKRRWLALALLLILIQEPVLAAAAASSNVPFKTSFVSASDNYNIRRQGALVSLPLANAEARAGGQTDDALLANLEADDQLQVYMREPDFQSERRPNVVTLIAAAALGQPQEGSIKRGDSGDAANGEATAMDDLLAASSAETASTRPMPATEAPMTTTTTTTTSSSSSTSSPQAASSTPNATHQAATTVPTTSTTTTSAATTQAPSGTSTSTPTPTTTSTTTGSITTSNTTQAAPSTTMQPAANTAQPPASTSSVGPTLNATTSETVTVQPALLHEQSTSNSSATTTTTTSTTTEAAPSSSTTTTSSPPASTPASSDQEQQQQSARSPRCGGRGEPGCGPSKVGAFVVVPVPVVEQHQKPGDRTRVVNEFVFLPEDSGLLLDDADYPTRKPNDTHTIDPNSLKAEHRGALEPEEDLELDYVVNTEGGQPDAYRTEPVTVTGRLAPTNATEAASTAAPASSTTAAATSTSTTTTTTSTTTSTTTAAPTSTQRPSRAPISISFSTSTSVSAASRRAPDGSRLNQKLLRLPAGDLAKSTSTSSTTTAPSRQKLATTTDARRSQSAHRPFYSEPADLRRTRNKYSAQVSVDDEEAKILTRYPLASQLTRLSAASTSTSSGSSHTLSSSSSTTSTTSSTTTTTTTRAPQSNRGAFNRAPETTSERRNGSAQVSLASRLFEKWTTPTTTSTTSTTTTSTVRPPQASGEERLILVADSLSRVAQPPPPPPAKGTTSTTTSTTSTTTTRRPVTKAPVVVAAAATSSRVLPSLKPRRLADDVDEYEGSVEDQLAKDALHTNRSPRDDSTRRTNTYTRVKPQVASEQQWHDSGRWQPDEPSVLAASGGHQSEASSGLLPGQPGVDYPIHWQVPRTSFDCRNYQQSGFYADVESDCQAYHSCHRGRGGRHTFLCPNGTLFSQELLTCDWWYNVECSLSKLYHNGADGGANQLG